MTHLCRRSHVRQTVNLRFEASDYSTAFALVDASVFGTGNVSIVSSNGNVVTGSASVRKDLPVTIERFKPSTCRSYGDPHFTTFDKTSYDFQSTGE